VLAFFLPKCGEGRVNGSMIGALKSEQRAETVTTEEEKNERERERECRRKRQTCPGPQIIGLHLRVHICQSIRPTVWQSLAVNHRQTKRAREREKLLFRTFW
jgi:hypothetical protein